MMVVLVANLLVITNIIFAQGLGYILLPDGGHNTESIELNDDLSAKSESQWLAVFFMRALERITSILYPRPRRLISPIPLVARFDPALDLLKLLVFLRSLEILCIIPISQVSPDIGQGCIRSFHLLLNHPPLVICVASLLPDLDIQGITVSDEVAELSNLFGGNARFLRCRLQQLYWWTLHRRRR
jgi:hypothetical protein